MTRQIQRYDEYSEYDDLPPALNPRSWRAFFLLAMVTLSIAFLGLLAYAAYLVRDWLPVVGYIWLGVIAAVPVLALCFGVAWSIKYLNKLQIDHIGVQGSVVRDWLGRTSYYAPMSPASVRQVANRNGKVTVTPVVPSILDLLGSDIVIHQSDMVHGFQIEKNIVTTVKGPLPSLSIIAGKGGSGKSRRAIAMIFQAILTGAKVTVCDPHGLGSKPDAIYKVLKDFAPWVTFALTDRQIIDAARDHIDEMTSRILGYSRNDEGTRPRVIVYDEWAFMMKNMADADKALLIASARESAVQWRAVGGNAWIISQEFTEDAMGDTALRKDAQAIFCHQLSDEYSKYLFPKDAKTLKAIMNLPRKECIYNDLDNVKHQIESINVPDIAIPELVAYLEKVLPVKKSTQPQIYTPVPPALAAVSFSRDGHSQPIDGNMAYSMENGEYSQRLIDAPAEPIDVENDLENILYSRSDNGNTGNDRKSFSIEDETFILSAVLTMTRLHGKEPKRTDLARYLREIGGKDWNLRAKYQVIKDVCDLHGISIRGGKNEVA